MEQGSGAVLDNLYPALTECFAIILCGYVAGRINLISETEAKGINTFVGTFALPSLIFMSLAQLDLESVNWLFLLSILIAKSLVFFAVIAVTLLVGRPVNLSRAGLFAIFCTQSNDFAIGYPIVQALYKQSHPDYPSYLYLMAPISLAILNPIAFVFMELGKRRAAIAELSDLSTEMSKVRLVAVVARNIATNPIVLMTLLGVLGNFVFSHQVPCYLGQFLDALGSAFSASALFLLGLRMVGKVHKLRGAKLVLPGILIMVKLLALPLVTREVVSLVKPGMNDTENIDLSTYGFLYGTFPSAPTVFVFATQYAIDIDLIASAMVACTFISAPFMFVSAKMIALSGKTSPSEYLRQLDAFTMDVSIAACVASLWVLFVFTLTKKIGKLPHRITACLVVSQLISCVGAILWNTLQAKSGWAGYIQFLVFAVGVYSSRLWTAILAVALLFLQCRSLCHVVKLQPVFVAVGWGVPVVLTVVLLLFEMKNHGTPFNDNNPNFVYGTGQAVVAVTLLVFCFIVTVGCMILQERHRRRYNRYVDLIGSTSGALPTARNHGNGSTYSNGSNHGNGLLPDRNLPTINELADSPTDIEDLLGSPRSSSGVCAFGDRCQTSGDCQSLVQQYRDPIDDDLEYNEEGTEVHDAQLLRHTVLLIALVCSMFVGLALSIWTLVMDQMSGIYIELSFLDATLNFGQSLLVLAIFGLDTKSIIFPLLKLWRKLYYGANTLVLPSQVTAVTQQVCDQFRTHHLDHCRVAIATDRRWRLKVYRGAFTGVEFVDWLLAVGLARDRGGAVSYARDLVEGRLLTHVNGVYHFYDRNLLYTFNLM